MTKILLVEDDKSLREIYGVRLLAEGYDIVSAGDGEEALAMAIKERPAMIVADVMMPRISGFDMLDILRSTTETKNIKVIIMTALSSEDQRRHGEQLGADRYLVKSQVGIEDVVRVVHEVLGDLPASATSQKPATAPNIAAPPQAARPTVPPTMMRQPPVFSQRNMQVDTMTRPVASATTATPQFTPGRPMPPSTTTPVAPSVRQRTIQPINDPTKKIDIQGLLDKELAREAGISEDARPSIATTQQERTIVENQLRTSPTNRPAAQPISVSQQTVQATPVQPRSASQPATRPPLHAPQRPNEPSFAPQPDNNTTMPSLQL